MLWRMRLNCYTENGPTALQIGVESPSLWAVTEAAQPIPSNSKIIDLDPLDTSDDEHWIESPSLWPVTEAAQPIPSNSKIIDLDPSDTLDDKHWIESPSLQPVTEAAQPIPGNSKIIDLDSSDALDDEHWISMFWEKNKWLSGLPSIQMIFDAIEHPEETAQQQQPTVIWQEIMNLHTPDITEQ